MGGPAGRHVFRRREAVDVRRRLGVGQEPGGRVSHFPGYRHRIDGSRKDETGGGPISGVEACAQVLLRVFLQWIVNGGGRLEREYGLGRMRTDLLIVWPLPGNPGKPQKAVIKCKILRGSLESTLDKGLKQTRDYMDRCAASEGHLVIFDRSEAKLWEEKLYRRDELAGDQPITVWGA